MSLNKFIPDNNQNWLIKNNMIYYHHYCNIPVLQKRGDTCWIILDLRVSKQVLKMCKHFCKMDIPFYFSSKALNSNQDLDTEESKREIIRTYLWSLSNSILFDGIAKTGVDYVENLTNYLVEYKCMSEFKDEYEKCKKTFLSSSYDFYANGQVFKVPRDDMRDFMSGLERQIKLNLFL